MSPQSSRVLSPDAGGPSAPPPTVPEGWLAQWEGSSKKWYFVQPATGKSQWDIPTEPFIPTPSSTPHSIASPGPYGAPRAGSLAPSESEATREFEELRSGKWRTGENYSNSPFDQNMQTPPAGVQYYQTNTPGSSQRTPTIGDPMQQSRPSSQGILNQVATDLANRSNADDMMGVQPTTQATYSPAQTTPGQYSTAEQPYQQPYSQNQTPQSQMQDEPMAQVPPQSQNDASAAGISFSPQQRQSPAYGMADNSAMHVSPAPSSIPRASPSVPGQYSENKPNHPGMAAMPNNTPMDMGAQYQQYPGQTQSPQQGMGAYPGQPKQPEGYYQSQAIPVPSGQFPRRISPSGQPVQPPPPRGSAITVIHREPGSAPIFPTSHREAERQRAQRSQPTQGGYSGQPPPAQYDRAPMDPYQGQGRGYQPNSGPPQEYYGAPPGQGNGQSWEYQLGQMDAGGGYPGGPGQQRYTPPHPPPHYRSDSGGRGGWGR